MAASLSRKRLDAWKNSETGAMSAWVAMKPVGLVLVAAQGDEELQLVVRAAVCISASVQT